MVYLEEYLMILVKNLLLKIKQVNKHKNMLLNKLIK